MASDTNIAKRLTPKQEAFVNAYLDTANCNATMAAKEAGYAGSYSALGVQGHENLKNPKIRAEIDRRLAEKAAMGPQEVLQRLADQARGVGAFVTLETADGVPGIDIEAMKRAGLAHLIKGVRPTANGPVVEFYDAQQALIQLGRHHKLFTDQTNVGITIDAVLGALPQEFREAVRGELAALLQR